jgi:membrane protein implicated in regulation of membrane protease activity
MKAKLINILTGIVIYFALAAIIEFVIGWGMQHTWIFIGVWSVIMAVADALIIQPFRKRMKAVKKQKPLK